MKKLIFTLALTFISIGFGNAQVKLRRDYNQVCFYDSNSKKDGQTGSMLSIH